MEPYLCHGIRFYNYDLLEEIIKSGYIMPRCMLKNQDKLDKNNIFNGTKYISLSQKSLNSEYMSMRYRSSYDEYIYEKPSFILKRDNIYLIFPNMISLIEKDMMSPDEWHSIIFKDDFERYSYYCDELQTKEKISLKNNLIALGMPMNHLKMNYSQDDIKRKLEKIKELLINIGCDVPITNSSVYSFADNLENINKNKIL